MALRGQILACSAMFALLAPGAAQAWTKAYVVEWFEPAFRFGGAAGASPDAPGVDCPGGANDIDVRKELTRSYRSEKQINYLMNPENGILPIITNFGFRGPNAENIYENPTSLPDPGFREVKSTIAEGLNLDGDETTGFTGVDGEKGIDNAYYKAAGCVRRYRGLPKESSTGKFHMNIMQEGSFTVLLVLTGDGGDPMNDENVTVGFYTSPDDMVKDGEGRINPDYTYRIDPEVGLQSVFKARVRNGVLEEAAPTTIRTHDSMQTLNDRPWMTLEKARIRFDLKSEGGVQGIVAGYRDWFELFRGPVGNGGDLDVRRSGGGQGQGAIAERLGRFNAVGLYYALRRNADGLRDPATGQNRGISTAYRYFLQPAFVVTPDASDTVEVARIYDK